jgi:hypothetical protein
MLSKMIFQKVKEKKQGSSFSPKVRHASAPLPWPKDMDLDFIITKKEN